MAKVLYITYDGICDPLGRSQILPYLEGLACFGHRVHIVSLEKKERLLKNEKYLAKQLAEKNILWSKTIYSHSVPLFSQRNNLKRLKKLACEAFSKENFSIVHCRSYLASLCGLELKKKYACKFIFDMRGFWADERVEGNIWNKKNPLYARLYRYFKNKEKEFLKKADHIVTLTEAGKKEILSWQGFSSLQNISVIPCCADEKLFSPLSVSEKEKDELRDSLGIKKEDRVVTYLGSIGTWYMPDEMLDFFSVLKKKNNNAKFLFLTHDEPSSILEKSKRHAIDASSLIIRSIAREEVPGYISLCNFSVFFIRATFSKKASSPTKMAELLFMGKPVLTNSGIGDCDEIVQKNKAGIILDDFTEKAYEKAIAQMEILLKQGEDHFRNVAKEYFSLGKGIKEYDAIYSRLQN